MYNNTFNISGLTNDQVIGARDKFGPNTMHFRKENGFLMSALSVAKEPMVILLVTSSVIYFVIGDWGDGIFLLSAVLLVSAISLYQNARSRNALEKLRALNTPSCTVIRNSMIQQVNCDDIVVGDSMIIDEGCMIAADGAIVHSNDFSVNESILTGESLSVFKGGDSSDKLIYAGTTVTSGLAIVVVTSVGNQTSLGKIGKSIDEVEVQGTPLQLQINHFVKKMALVGAFVFVLVWVINYFRTYNILDSLLKALTLAMSILPEEIPIAFTTFMALGAWRLMQIGVVVKEIKTVETLGSATVICLDKTGTITENKMKLARIFALTSENISTPEQILNTQEQELISLSMWASEPIPFDPMEVALHNAYSMLRLEDERQNYKMIHEYPLGGSPPMMTHIFENTQHRRIIAAKGAPEAIMAVCKLSSIEKDKMDKAIKVLGADGFRILAVAEASFAGNDFPIAQQEFHFTCKGIVAFYDPPKNNIASVFNDFYSAGISVRIVTGDNSQTTAAIARQIGFQNYDKLVAGDEIMKLNETDLQTSVKDNYIFSRMFPDAKLKIVNAFKSQHEIVAMTGDGVNDGPALKAADIGIAMGKKGTEIARRAASMILTNDDLSSMVLAIAMGRRIYANLKKAIRYIISIHIPIILTVFTPLALGWIYPNLFTPVHIIFLELIMGPTCSIIYENEPMEKDLMKQKPRKTTFTFFTWNELGVSIVQGLMITAACLITYQYAVNEGHAESVVRTMVFTVLISANIFLTLVNRSFTFSLFKTLTYKNRLVPVIIGITIFLLAMLLFIPGLRRFFEFSLLTPFQLIFSLVIGSISVCWYELVKWRKRKQASADTIVGIMK